MDQVFLILNQKFVNLSWINKMGILDPKTRIFDTLLTQEGKRQIVSGKLKPVFYSFSDASTFYSKEDLFRSGSVFDGDGSFWSRTIHLETTNLPQDSIILESDNQGRVIVKDLILSSSSLLSGSSGESFDLMLSYSLSNYENMQLLGDVSPSFNQNNNFEFSPQNLTFVLPTTQSVASVENVESLFADKRFSHVDNYKFLPPRNKKTNFVSESVSLGNFPQIGQRPVFEFEELSTELRTLKLSNSSHDVSFLNTSTNNRLFCQMFEYDSAGDKMLKLDVIDFGVFPVTLNRSVEYRQVFFVGKLFQDSRGSHTFINMFTLVWS
jgi:hypothetical protein